MLLAYALTIFVFSCQSAPVSNLACSIVLNTSTLAVALTVS